VRGIFRGRHVGVGAGCAFQARACDAHPAAPVDFQQALTQLFEVDQAFAQAMFPCSGATDPCFKVQRADAILAQVFDVFVDLELVSPDRRLDYKRLHGLGADGVEESAL